LLVLNGIRFGKTHDIGELLELVPLAQRPGLDAEAAFRLTRSAVASRCPDASQPSSDEAQRLVQYVEQARQSLRAVLPSELLEP
jgi:HEPN domain-containing protein